MHEDEPLPQDSPWHGLANMTLLRHLASPTAGAEENLAHLAAQASAEFCRLRRCASTVNPAALESRSRQALKELR